MTGTVLSKELIADTAEMRLILRIEARRLSALIIGAESVEPTLIFGREELPDPSVRALENAVYDNPLLLGDFAGIDIVFADTDFFLFPTGASPLLDDMASAMLPDIDAPRTILQEPIGAATIGYAVDSDRLNFLSRTFACARFHHSVAVVANHIAALPDRAGFHALISSPTDSILCAFAPDGTLRYLNRPQTFGANDCAYYILAAAVADETLTLAALDPELRASVADTITKVKPSTRMLPPDFAPALLNLRRRAPEAAFDMLFLARQ